MTKIMYHVTETRKVPIILKKGLEKCHRKNVRLSKKCVNYVMSDMMHTGFFASQMSWGTKKPVSILYVKVNPKKLTPDCNTGATCGVWWEYNDNILPKDIVKVESWDDKAKKRHMKLMNERFK